MKDILLRRLSRGKDRSTLAATQLGTVLVKNLSAIQPRADGDNVKKIEAIIKPFKLDEVKEALHEIGVS
ncbi:MAG: P-II family nitrogen regulator, partial [Erythrobacter sp.]|nr:P-II family nitrogen regulator [Erythrobacter sp.]